MQMNGWHMPPCIMLCHVVGHEALCQQPCSCLAARLQLGCAWHQVASVLWHESHAALPWPPLQAQYEQVRAMAEAQGIVVPPEGGSAARPPPQQPQLRPVAARPAHPGQQQQQQQQQQRVWYQAPQQQQAPQQAPQQRMALPAYAAPPPQGGQLQHAAHAAGQPADAAARVAQQQARVAASLRQRLQALEQGYKVDLEGAKAAAARFPAPVGPSLLARSRQAISAAYEQRRAQLQQELQQAEAAAGERQQQQGLGSQPWQQPLRPQPIRLQQPPAALGPRQQQHGQAQQQEQHGHGHLGQQPVVPLAQLPKGVPATVGGTDDWLQWLGGRGIAAQQGVMHATSGQLPQRAEAAASLAMLHRAALLIAAPLVCRLRCRARAWRARWMCWHKPCCAIVRSAPSCRAASASGPAPRSVGRLQRC